jgi:hypothetical protein
MARPKPLAPLDGGAPIPLDDDAGGAQHHHKRGNKWVQGIRLGVALIAALMLITPGWPCTPPLSMGWPAYSYEVYGKVQRVLEQQKVNYFLASSGLAGAHRRGENLWWDYADLDFGIDLKDYHVLFPDAVEAFAKEGLTVTEGRPCGATIYNDAMMPLRPGETLFTHPRRWFNENVTFLLRTPVHVDVHCCDGKRDTELLQPHMYEKKERVKFGPLQPWSPVKYDEVLQATFGPHWRDEVMSSVCVRCLNIKMVLGYLVLLRLAWLRWRLGDKARTYVAKARAAGLLSRPLPVTVLAFCVAAVIYFTFTRLFLADGYTYHAPGSGH